MQTVGARPSCETAWVIPAIVSVPFLDWSAALPATEYVTVPGPVPAVPEAIAIHAALALALHAHPAAAVTVTLAVPPALPKLELAGVMLNVQTGEGSVGDSFPPQLAPAMKAAAINTPYFRRPIFMVHLGACRSKPSARRARGRRTHKCKKTAQFAREHGRFVGATAGLTRFR